MHVAAAAMWKLDGLPRWAKWGTGTPHVQLQGVTTLECGQHRWILRDPFMMDVDLGDVVCTASPSIWAEDPLSLSSRGVTEQQPLASKAVPYSPLQFLASRTQTVSSPRSSSPDRELSLIGGNRTSHPSPGSNSPTPPWGLGMPAADISYSPSPCFSA